jgi:hypothetical protein
MAHNEKNREINRQPKPNKELPPAGPHDKPELTDTDKTAGTAMLPKPDEKESDRVKQRAGRCVCALSKQPVRKKRQESTSRPQPLWPMSTFVRRFGADVVIDRSLGSKTSS